MKKKIYIALSLALMGLSLSSCNDYLDTMPDNRTTIDTEDKVKSILVSAYPDRTYGLVTETMSDNVDNLGDDNTSTSRFLDQAYAWEDITESNNDDMEKFWNTSYSAIANANLALEGIENLGGATTESLKELKAEALLARAFNHFNLVNIFCKAYNKQTSGTDLGMAYVDKPLTTLKANLPRGTVAEDYEKIDRDIQEALPMVGDNHLDQPKYHFNIRAAYAFAARFYLFYEKWDEAVKYANLCLGTLPKTMLRDWKEIASMTQKCDAVSQYYAKSSLACNLMLGTAVSNLGYTYSDYPMNEKYMHNRYIANHEDAGESCANIWGSDKLYSPMHVYVAAQRDKVIFWKNVHLFEYKDVVAATGSRRTVIPVFTTEECLLVRAEAYIMQKEYDKAAQDLTTWMQGIVNTTKVLTPESITAFYAPIAYSYTPTASDPDGLQSTIKKHLHPSFEIDAEGSTQECMLQCLLEFRRIETLQMGMRWFDIKRYGIEIIRRTLDANGTPAKKTDVLTLDDERRAIQLPQTVIDAGVVPNPRNN